MTTRRAGRRPRHPRATGPTAPPHARAGRLRLAGAFESAQFRWVWGAALAGNSGRFAVLLVAGWEAFRLGHDSSLWPSLVSFLLFVPTTCLGLVSGRMADRLNRAVQAAAGQLLNAAGCAVAAVAALTGRLDLWAVLAVSAVVGVGNSVQGPAWQALVPRLVGRDRILNASALARIAQQGAELTGPALGTLVLTTAGPGPVFVLCSGCYLAGTAMVWRVRRAEAARPAAEPGAPRRTIGEGVSYLGRTAPLATLMLWVGLHCSLTMASMGILPAVASANLSGQAGAYGVLMTAFGLGSVAGPLLLLAVGDRQRPGLLLLISGLASGIPLAGLGLAHSEVAAALWSAAAGAGQAVFMAGIYSANMTVTADEFRGRVASIQLSLTTGLMGAASLGWGALAGLMAPGLVLLVPGLAFVAACGPFGARLASIDRGILAHRRLPQQARSPAVAPADP